MSRIWLFLTTFVVIEALAMAHSGRLDSNGGHHDRKNGGYHYHQRRYSDGRSSVDSILKSNPPKGPTRETSKERRSTPNNVITPPRGRDLKDKDSDWHFHHWERKVKKSSSPSDVDERVFAELDGDIEHNYLFLEQFHSKAKGIDLSRFVISYAGDERSNPVNDPPPVEEIERHLQELHFKNGTVLYYLNGMNLQKVAWAHGEVHDDSVDVRVRKIDPREFQRSRLILDEHPIRTWKDISGKHSTDARFLSYANFKVVLRRANGRRIEIPLRRLSTADQAYVSDVRKNLVK